MRLGPKRTIGDTWRHIGHLVPTINAAECANYFQNASYPYGQIRNALVPCLWGSCECPVNGEGNKSKHDRRWNDDRGTIQETIRK